MLRGDDWDKKLMQMMETLLKNPITLWLKWLFGKLCLESKCWGRHLRIGYLARCSYNW